jgi:hypothetical protein
MYTHLCRVVDVLGDTGVCFSEDGVRLQRPDQVSTVLHSNGAAA